ncbi:MAG: hypothetical protein JJW00_03570 [Sulfurimonas sp.]|nr:hypothetical protein [Sulfurimonas sp.]
MNIENLFKKAENFFVLDKNTKEEKKEKKKEKLESLFVKKIANLKKKIKKENSSDDKKKLKKQLGILDKFLEKIEDK